tara:strand:- start:256 stop:678 length:423 start_codon:yes stop_codon:yes gene_type:complete
MKHILLLVLIAVQTVVFSQKETISGTYRLDFEGSNGIYTETLILYSDGNFNFHSFKKFDGMHPPESHLYGKGRWELKDNIVRFTANKTDIDSKYTLNFNNSEARFSTKSPRDKSNREIPTLLTFFKSNIKWLSRRKLEKH